MSLLIDALVQAASAALSFSIGRLLERRAYNAKAAKLEEDAEGKELENTKEIIKMWREQAEDLYKKSISLSHRCDWLQSELNTVVAENQALKLTLEKFKNYEN